jgi:hypothetical protein
LLLLLLQPGVLPAVLLLLNLHWQGCCCHARPWHGAAAMLRVLLLLSCC